MEKILTVPSLIEDKSATILTGNHYVSVPEIGGNGEIRCISLLSGRLRALMEFTGDIRPFVRINGEEICLESCGYIHDFIPQFRGQSGRASFGLSYAAPGSVSAVNTAVNPF